MRRLHDLGARGIRVNAVGGSTLSIAQLKSIAPRLRAVVTEGSGAVLRDCIIASGVQIGAGAVVGPGVVLAANATVPDGADLRA